MLYAYNKTLCSDGNELTIITHKNMMLNEKETELRRFHSIRMKFKNKRH